jgi:hypothetical protein
LIAEQTGLPVTVADVIRMVDESRATDIVQIACAPLSPTAR